MIPIRTFQQEHERWQSYNFGALPPESDILGMLEELGELAHAYTKHQQGNRVTENHIDNMADAIGDIFIFMMGFCTKMGFDIESIIETTWKDVQERNWVVYPKNGRTE